MQPATISLCARPDFLYSAISRIVSTDSCLAGSMKLQVLTTRTSASLGCWVSSWPRATSWPIITSVSTRFLGQPRLTKPTFKVVDPGGEVRNSRIAELLQVVEFACVLAQHHVRDFDRARACDLAIMHHL